VVQINRNSKNRGKPKAVTHIDLGQLRVGQLVVIHTEDASYRIVRIEGSTRTDDAIIGIMVTADNSNALESSAPWLPELCRCDRYVVDGDALHFDLGNGKFATSPVFEWEIYGGGLNYQ